MTNEVAHHVPGEPLTEHLSDAERAYQMQLGRDKSLVAFNEVLDHLVSQGMANDDYKLLKDVLNTAAKVAGLDSAKENKGPARRILNVQINVPLPGMALPGQPASVVLDVSDADEDENLIEAPMSPALAGFVQIAQDLTPFEPE